MRLHQHVFHAVDDAVAGKFDSALLHACIAVDATSRRQFPNISKVGKRFTDTLRSYYWLLEPMVGTGINLVETRFSNVKSTKNPDPDFADIVYEKFRCPHAHGDESESGFLLTTTTGPFLSSWEMTHDAVHMPDRIIWALLGVSVFSRFNKGEHGGGDRFLSMGSKIFPIRSWWGREHEVRPIADSFNTTRVILKGLGDMMPISAGEHGEIEELHIFSPPKEN